MVKEEIKLRGYLGEAVVKQWLNRKYPSEEKYSIVSQIIPRDVPKKGGGYLDFGVIKNEAVVAVYEVKTWDYIFSDNDLNHALKYLWKNTEKELSFDVQDSVTYSGRNVKTCLVLLAPPNEKGIQTIGEDNIRNHNVILFADILDELGDIDVNAIINDIKPLIKKEIENIRKIRTGKTFLPKFNKLRSKF